MRKTILRPFLLTLLLSVSGLLFSQVPQGAINGLFSVSDNQHVVFSQGNLQYIGSASTPYWKFAEQQWEYLGDNGQGSTNQNANRDLFGWGTSGYNHGAVCYQPWSTSQTSSDYYAYGAASYNLYDQSGQADWGYNAILNGGNQENSGWRTLSTTEWGYVFNTRTTASGIRYAKANVNGVNGVILLPDDWSTSYYSLNNTNQGNASFDSNTISASQWNTLEQHGAVFLPAAGRRYGPSVDIVGSVGLYWSASFYNNISSSACSVGFDSSDINAQGSGNSRYTGLSVRLVCSAQTYSINASKNPPLGGAVSGGGTYLAGACCTLRVTANAGYDFLNWTKDGVIVSTNPTYSFTVTEAGHYVANLYDVTDVQEISAEDFALYPNPVDNILVIDGPSEINSCEIYNLTGQLVYKEMDCQQKIEINTSRLPVGAYLVKLVSNGKVFTRKFLKK